MQRHFSLGKPLGVPGILLSFLLYLTLLFQVKGQGEINAMASMSFLKAFTPQENDCGVYGYCRPRGTLGQITVCHIPSALPHLPHTAYGTRQETGDTWSPGMPTSTKILGLTVLAMSVLPQCASLTQYPEVFWGAKQGSLDGIPWLF